MGSSHGVLSKLPILGRQWIIVKPLAALRAIGDPCAGKRWQDHHIGVVVFFIGITTILTSELL